ncbi:hypothetical protein LCGC14_2348710 [marine sediment metagenome]|uniref:Uncharacterized protein n=1 Tax=marine sediment metagenome TaxID=412755 RepID=A0A0F9F4V2_9ZZZZ
MAFGFIETHLIAAQENAEAVAVEGKQIQLRIPGQLRQMATMLIPLGRPGTSEATDGS